MEKLSAEFQLLVQRAGVETPVLGELRRGKAKPNPSVVTEWLLENEK